MRWIYYFLFLLYLYLRAFILKCEEQAKMCFCCFSCFLLGPFWRYLGAEGTFLLGVLSGHLSEGLAGEHHVRSEFPQPIVSTSQFN